MKTHILAIGRMKGAEAELIADYAKRMIGDFKIKELTASTQKAEGEALRQAIPAKAFIIMLDEHGQDLSSRELADKLTNWRDNGINDLVFLIGGADGHTPETKSIANFALGMGRKTWPHKLVRLMLVEQLYRAQQINANHPYHRD